MAMNPIDVDFLTCMAKIHAAAQEEIRRYWETAHMSGAQLDPEVSDMATNFMSAIEGANSQINTKLENGTVDAAENALQYAMDNVEVMSNTRPEVEVELGF